MIRIFLRDITELTDVDVIVNSAKKSLLGGGGVDGAIHNKAGSELRRACKELNGCAIGEAKITKGYNLPVPYIIHTVGPVHYDEKWAKEHNYNQAELLRNAYLNSLELAKEHNLKRIAFSAISTGAFCYPINEATKIALDTVMDFLKSNSTFEITFALYSEDAYEEYIKQIKNYENISYHAEKFDIHYEQIIPINEIIKARNIIENAKDLENELPSIQNNRDNIFKKLMRKLIKR